MYGGGTLQMKTPSHLTLSRLENVLTLSSFACQIFFFFFSLCPNLCSFSFFLFVIKCNFVFIKDHLEDQHKLLLGEGVFSLLCV